jgi:hypothetical protein
MVVFSVRAYDSRKIVPFKLRLPKLITNNALLLSMVLINVLQKGFGTPKIFSIIALPILFIIVFAINIKPVWNAVMAIMPKKIKAIVDRLGVKKLIALGVAAAVYIVLCYLTHGWLIAAATAAVTALGITLKKDTLKLGGAGCTFLTVWAISGISAAFLMLLVLSALDYLRKPSGVVCAIGCVSLVAVTAAIGGGLAAVFCALVIILAAAVTNLGAINDLLNKILKKI